MLTVDVLGGELRDCRVTKVFSLTAEPRSAYRAIWFFRAVRTRSAFMWFHANRCEDEIKKEIGRSV
jgi:hypothetical protein